MKIDIPVLGPQENINVIFGTTLLEAGNVPSATTTEEQVKISSALTGSLLAPSCPTAPIPTHESVLTGMSSPNFNMVAVPSGTPHAQTWLE